MIDIQTVGKLKNWRVIGLGYKTTTRRLKSVKITGGMTKFIHESCELTTVKKGKRIYRSTRR